MGSPTRPIGYPRVPFPTWDLPGAQGSLLSPGSAFLVLDPLTSRLAVACPSCVQVNPTTGVVTCECHRCGSWCDFVEGRDPAAPFRQYEVLTQEHVQGLASYLRCAACASPRLLSPVPLRHCEVSTQTSE